MTTPPTVPPAGGVGVMTDDHIAALEQCRWYMGTCTTMTNPNAPNWYALAGEAIALLRSAAPQRVAGGAVGGGELLGVVEIDNRRESVLDGIDLGPPLSYDRAVAAA